MPLGDKTIAELCFVKAEEREREKKKVRSGHYLAAGGIKSVIKKLLHSFCLNFLFVI